MADAILQFQAAGLRSPEERPILAKVDWSLARGERVLVRADQDSDGTMFLRLAVGLGLPQEGRVLLDGAPFHPYTFDHPFLMRGAVGWLPGDGGLIQNLSLLANVTLPLRFVRGLAARDAEGLAMEALKQAGLKDRAGRRPHGLEPRDRWLGALARAALMEPELWLVDGPYGDLDDATLQAAERLLAPSLERPGTSALVAWDEGARLFRTTQTIKLAGGRVLPEG